MKITSWAAQAALVSFSAGVATAWNNGAALTPPMGWANWNQFGCNYDDAVMRSIADALVSTGLRDAGYLYVLVQECIVPAGSRNASTGVVIPDPVKFPYGLDGLATYFHDNGLLAGIYTDVFHLTCAGYEGSGAGPNDPAGHWPLDAMTYAQWGYDLIEADFCNGGGVNLTAHDAYKIARDAIGAASAAVSRPILFYQCNWGEQQPYLWFPEVSNLARQTGDICAPGAIYFANILNNFDNTIIHSPTPGSAPGMPGTGVGAWLDPDMLGVGMTCCISDVEGRTQMSLWCILGAPLFLGTDVRNMSATTLATISNAAAIAINQDPLGVQGTIVQTADSAYQGGTLLNLTNCGSSGMFAHSMHMAAPQLVDAAQWTLTSDGHVQNGDGSSCLTVEGCYNTPGSMVFSYACVTNTCQNQLWSWNAATGAIVSHVLGNSSLLCLTGVDPAGGPFSQLTVDVCDGRASQAWNWSVNSTLRIPAFSGSSALCVTQGSGLDMYMKPLAPTNVSVTARGRVRADTPRAGQDIALAVLNRGDAAALGVTVDLTAFSFAPAQPVVVFDVWMNSTSGPYMGSFTSRGLQSHETVLLRLSLA